MNLTISLKRFSIAILMANALCFATPETDQIARVKNNFTPAKTLEWKASHDAFLHRNKLYHEKIKIFSPNSSTAKQLVHFINNLLAKEKHLNNESEKAIKLLKKAAKKDININEENFLKIFKKAYKQHDKSSEDNFIVKSLHVTAFFLTPNSSQEKLRNHLDIFTDLTAFQTPEKDTFK